MRTSVLGVSAERAASADSSETYSRTRPSGLKDSKLKRVRRAADGLIVFAHDPVLAVDVEGVDDVALAAADAWGSALASTTEDGAFAVEFIPTAEGCFDDDQIFVGEPELRLSSDDGAVLELGGFVLMQA